MAALQGHAQAQFSLGGNLMLGLGVDQNVTQTFFWICKTAHHRGFAASQPMLGLLYLEADDDELMFLRRVNSNYGTEDRASFWLQKAPDQGHPNLAVQRSSWMPTRFSL